MNTKLNLWKDKKISLKLHNKEITQEAVYQKSQKCDENFDIWQRCIKTKSWNDEHCLGQLKPKYEHCIQKRNLMQTILDTRIDEN